MSACPQLVMCSRIWGFQHLVIRFCGDLVRWKSKTVSALGSSSCPSDRMSGVWIHMAATGLTMQRLTLDPEIKPLTFLCSCAMSKRSKEGLSADITNTSVCGDDVLD